MCLDVRVSYKNQSQCLHVINSMEEADLFIPLQRLRQCILKRTINIQAIYSCKFLHPKNMQKH